MAQSLIQTRFLRPGVVWDPAPAFTGSCSGARFERAEEATLLEGCAELREGSVVWPSLRAGRSHLDKYGVGVRLYFDFLLSLAVVAGSACCH